MNTNWSNPKTNIFAGMKSLGECLANGHNAKLIKEFNENCEFPIKIKNINSNFRNYKFSSGHSTSIDKINADANLSEFEKYLTLNYVSTYGTNEAAETYYKTGVYSADNFNGIGISHLIKVDDIINFYEFTGNTVLADMYKKQYRTPEHTHVNYLFSFFRYNGESQNSIKKFKHKLWVVAILNDNSQQKIPVLVHIMNFILFPLKFIPKKSVLRMQEYKIVTYRIGSVINGFTISFQIPNKFSFK